MPPKYPIIAIAYDFDGTLSPGNMQEHSFIPDLGIKKSDFWKKVKELARKNDMDEILAYMRIMLIKADSRSMKINKRGFLDRGKGIPLFEGVNDWFDRITKYGKGRKLNVEHYIVSSGLKEIIEGTKIYNKFKYVFASGFMYDQHEVACWPALDVNYTNKTQYLFRINKGIMNSYENTKINKYIPNNERRIPFRNMIYIGDGETDIPAMKMTTYQGGHAIAVYDPKKRSSPRRRSPKEIAIELLEQERANYAVPADYQENSQLDKLVKLLLDKISIENELSKVNK